MAQDAIATAYNRYPDVFRTVRIFADQYFGVKPLRILSFGCSSGQELATLRAYFPDAALFGCDVNEKAMREAARVSHDSRIFRSNPNAISAFGPYDVIFAMSVLCRFSKSKKAASIADIFSFDEFEGHIATLDSALNVGGLLCIHNANYLFSQSVVYPTYAPVRSPLIASNGFVDKWTATGTRISSVLKSDIGREHVLVNVPPTLTDDDFRDVIFRKGEQKSIEMSQDLSPIGAITAERASGPDLQAAIAGRRIAVNSVDRLLITNTGETWFGRSWRKSTVMGTVMQSPDWWARGSPEMIGQFTAEQRRHLIQVATTSSGLKRRIASDDYVQSEHWQPWFAWRPVRMVDGTMRWMQTVYRHCPRGDQCQFGDRQRSWRYRSSLSEPE